MKGGENIMTDNIKLAGDQKAEPVKTPTTTDPKPAEEAAKKE